MRIPRVIRIMRAGALLIGLVAAPASAGPEGEQVVQGDVQLSRDGSLTQIEASHNSIIDYQSFNIDAHETVQFIQPGASARVLNRILNNNPTQIDGALLANGQVYFLNPAGIFVGANALIDVAGLYAAAGSLSNEDFLERIDRFTDLSGPVENLGEIQAKFVHLLGEHVANYGSIVADGGIVTMVAGQDVYITESGGRVMIRLEGAAPPADPESPGVDQSGEIEAGRGQVTLKAGDLYSLAIQHPGKTRAHDILLEGGDDGVVNVAGMLDASDAVAGRAGGTITVLGDRVALIGALLDASGDAGGGTVLVGGDAHGQGEVRTASETFVSQDSQIRADALDHGDGGTVVLWADDAMRGYGTISARGGARSGAGGFVETSGKHYLEVSDAPDLHVPPCPLGGTWLLDPVNITIVDELEPGGPGDQSRVSDDAIEEVLNQGGEVIITTATTPDPGELGDIVQEAAARIEKTAGADASLKLFAANQIVLNGGIESSAGPLEVTLVADDAAQPDPFPGFGTILLNADIVTDGGALHLAADTTLAGTGTNANQRLDAGSAELRLSGSLTKTSSGQLTLVAGATTIGADITTQGSLRLGQNTFLTGSGEHANQRLDAGRGTLSASGSITKTTPGDLTLASTSEGTSVAISGTADVKQGSLRVEGNVEATALMAQNNIEVLGGILTAGIQAELGNIDIVGLAEVEGDVTAGLDVDFGEFANIEGAITAGQDIFLTEGVRAQSLDAGRDVEIDAFASVLSTLSAGRDIFLLEGLEAGGDVIAGGEVDIGENVGVTGSIRGALDVTIGGRAVVTGDIEAQNGSIDIDDTAEVGGDVRANEGILIFEEASARSFQSQTGDVEIFGAATASDFIDAAESIIIEGNASVSNAITAGTDLTIEGDVTAGSMTAGSNGSDPVLGDITVDRSVTIAGDVSATGGIEFNQGLEPNPDTPVTVGGAINAGGRFSIAGDISAESITALGYIDVLELNDQGPVTVNVDNAISGAEGVTIEGDVNAGSINTTNEFADIDVSGSATVTNAIDARGSVFVVGDASASLINASEGDITLGGRANVPGALSAGGNISLLGDISAESITALGYIDVLELADEGPVAVNVSNGIRGSNGINIEGDVSAASLSAKNELADIDVSGSATVTDAIDAGGSVSIVGDVSASKINATEGDITINGRQTVSGDITAGGGSVFVGGDLIASTIHARGDVTVLGNVAVGNGDVTAGNDISLNLLNQLNPDDTGFVTVLGKIDAGGSVSVGSKLTAFGDVTAEKGNVSLGGDSTLFEGSKDGFVTGSGIRAADDNGKISVDGNLLATGDIVAGGDIQLSGLVSLEGAESQRVEAGGKLVANTVSKTTDGKLELIGGTIELLTSIESGSIEARDALELRTTGTSSREDRATIVANGALDLRSTSDDVIMQTGDLMFVEGALSISAKNEVALADISADGPLSIEADSIVLLNPRATTGSQLGFETKEGSNRVNIFGRSDDPEGSSVTFGAIPNGANQIFGTPSGASGVMLGDATSSGDQVAGFDVVFTSGTLASSGAPLLFIVDNDINKETPLELPSTLPPGPPVYEQLRAVGAQRPLWSEELIAYLDCVGLAQCEPGSPSAATDIRLATVPAQTVMLSYRALFLEPDPMRRALQQAVDAFRSQHPGTPMTGDLLRAFIESDFQYADALAYMNKLARLFDEIERLNPSEREPGDTRLDLLEKLRPRGIELEELDGAIRAAAAHDPSLSNAG